MTFDVDGHSILSHGEFLELMRNLDPEAKVPTFGAWFAGERLSQSQAAVALDIEARLAAETERAHELIDRALGRLPSARDEAERNGP